MLAKLGIALGSGLLAAGAMATGYQMASGRSLWSQLADLLGPAPSSWGFELTFEPSSGPDGAPTDPVRCGTCAYESTHASWLDGPRGDLASRDPSELARDSLAWVEQRLASEEWSGREWLQLELSYPSGRRVVHVTHANGADQGWGEQLEDWFARLPPTGEGDLPGTDERVGHWVLSFETGSVEGWSENTPAGLEGIRGLVCELESAPGFGHAAVELTYSSGPLDVTRFCARDEAASFEQAWPQPLAAWLERFPPEAGAGYPDTKEPAEFSWTLTLAESGRIRGRAASAPEALTALRTLASSVEDMPSARPWTYDLGTMKRVPREDVLEFNSYRVETSDPNELDDLPARLGAQADLIL